MIIPDRWIVLQIPIKGKAPLYKVLAGWHGSYTEGEKWKLNSGIVDVKREGDYYLFKGNSGSVYKCHVKGYGLIGITGRILSKIAETGKGFAVGYRDFSDLLSTGVAK